MRRIASSNLRRFARQLCLVSIGIGPGAQALAGTDAIRSEDNSLWLAGGASHLNYAERADDRTNLDSEFGWLPSVAGGVSLLGGPGLVLPPNLYLALDSQGSWGKLRYDGSLSDGTPFTGTTKEDIWSLSGRAGYAFPIMASAMLTPYVQLGYRHWDRDFGDYAERYHNGEVMGGLLAQVSPWQSGVFSLWGGVGSTFAGGMTATNPTMHFGLNDRLTWDVGAKAGYLVMPHLELFTRLNLERLRYGRSEDVLSPADGLYYYEPNSHTTDLTTQLGFAYNFM